MWKNALARFLILHGLGALIIIIGIVVILPTVLILVIYWMAKQWLILMRVGGIDSFEPILDRTPYFCYHNAIKTKKKSSASHLTD